MHGDEDACFPWLETLLLVSSVSLFLAFFPAAWWGLLAIIDVRNWSWRSYAAISTLAIVGLVGLKAWLERDD